MKRFLIVAALAIGLGACAQLQSLQDTLSIASNVTITQNEIDTVRSSYDAGFLAPAAHYRSLPLCLKGQTFIKNQCRTHKLTMRLQAADNAVFNAFNDVQAMITSGDNSGVSAAFRALKSAVQAAKDIITANNIS